MKVMRLMQSNWEGQHPMRITAVVEGTIFDFNGFGLDQKHYDAIDGLTSPGMSASVTEENGVTVFTRLVDTDEQSIGVQWEAGEPLASVQDTTFWNVDAVQFPRLLAEIVATQDTLDVPALAASMDLTVADVGELFDRAQAEWERIKVRPRRLSAKGHHAALEAIVNVRANGNSDPDRMAEALGYIDDVARAALDGKPLPKEPEGEQLHQCDNCGGEFDQDDLALVSDISERVDAGGPMPSGECPSCGALCYPVEGA